jgi:Flp pilus assembly pilin Flp
MSWLLTSRPGFFKCLKDQEIEGQGLVEYAMLLMLIAIACVASLTTLRSTMQAVFWDAILNVLIPGMGG